MTSLNVHEPMPTREEGSPEVWPQVLADVAQMSHIYEAADLVIADMRDRDRIGRERYGGPLVVSDGRDALVDLYQELLDAAVYTKKQQLREELDEPHQGMLDAVYRSLLVDAMLTRWIIKHKRGE